MDGGFQLEQVVGLGCIRNSYDLSKHELGTGSFSQDARGRWYFNTTVKSANKPSEGRVSVGIDLGLRILVNVNSDSART